VGGVTPVEDAGWPEDLRGGWTVEVRFEQAEHLDQLATQWRNARSEFRLFRKQSEVQGPTGPADRLPFLEERFRDFGYGHVAVRELPVDLPRTDGPAGLAYRVAVRSDYPKEVAGAHHMGVLFGLGKFSLGEVSEAEAVVGIQQSLANLFAGFFGMLVAILVSSSFVPTMLQKGSVDLILARPLGRVRILLFKYLGGVWFIFLLASFLIGGCWLALSLRTSFWNFWFLGTILTVTAIFAVVYSVSVLSGVLTRSSAVSALLAVAVWGLSGLVLLARQMLKMMDPADVPQSATAALDAAYAVVPKTGDLARLNEVFLARSNLSPGAMHRAMLDKMVDVNWSYSLGTTALFTAVVLAFAAWSFRRRDW
jgi:hypothetical protein